MHELREAIIDAALPVQVRGECAREFATRWREGER